MRLRDLLLSILLLVVAMTSCSGRRAAFLRFWYDWEKQCEGAKFSGIVETKIEFLELREIPIGTVPGSDVSSCLTEKAYMLYERKGLVIYLVTPKAPNPAITSATLNYNEDAYEQCSKLPSWLVAVPGKQWSEINLHPDCSLVYGPNEITIFIYDGPDVGTFVEFVTNSPATIPVALYELHDQAFRFVDEYGMPGC